MITLARLAEILQVVGWMLTLAGQVLVTFKQRSAFVVWAFANLALIGVQLDAQLFGSAGMFATNLIFCAWSYWRWR